MIPKGADAFGAGLHRMIMVAVRRSEPRFPPVPHPPYCSGRHPGRGGGHYGAAFI